MIEHVNAMPAPTWSWLRMNETSLDVPEGLAAAPAGSVSLELEGCSEAAEGALERALGDRAAAFRGLRRESAPGDSAHRGRAEAEGDEMGCPALSAYQEGAVRTEEAYTPLGAFETGMGRAAYAFIDGAAGGRTSVEVPAGADARVSLRVEGADGCVAASSLDLVAGAGSRVEVTVALDSPAPGSGVAASAMRVVAGPDARVSITCTQTLDDSWQALDDSGLFLDEGARVDVRHVVLGAGRSLTGLAADLAGDRGRIQVDTSYLGTRDQSRDFNYEIRHRGRATESLLDANGVLAGSSSKCLRGTIDLVHGCKGSTGTEHETVLIADDGVDNRTVPVILCDEDDVAGNHGATIGHVRPEQMFYLQCRGIAPDDAENLFLRAKLEDAALAAPDDRTRASVCRLGAGLFDDFEEELS